MGVSELVLELQALEAIIKGIFNRLYCYYGNLLYRKDDHNLFTHGYPLILCDVVK